MYMPFKDQDKSREYHQQYYHRVRKPRAISSTIEDTDTLYEDTEPIDRAPPPPHRIVLQQSLPQRPIFQQSPYSSIRFV